MPFYLYCISKIRPCNIRCKNVNFQMKNNNIFSSPEPKAHGELIVYQSSRRLCVCVCVSVSTLLNMNISETRGPIATKFYLKHHLGEGKAA